MVAYVLYPGNCSGFTQLVILIRTLLRIKYLFSELRMAGISFRGRRELCLCCISGKHMDSVAIYLTEKMMERRA